jgi:hypothetical protein
MVWWPDDFLVEIVEKCSVRPPFNNLRTLFVIQNLKCIEGKFRYIASLPAHRKLCILLDKRRSAGLAMQPQVLCHGAFTAEDSIPTMSPLAPWPDLVDWKRIDEERPWENRGPDSDSIWPMLWPLGEPPQLHKAESSVSASDVGDSALPAWLHYPQGVCSQYAGGVQASRHGGYG